MSIERVRGRRRVAAPVPIRIRLRHLLPCLLALAILAGTPALAAGDALYARALETLGGADRLRAITTVHERVHAQNFEPFQNRAADGPPNHVSDSEIEILWQPAMARFRIATRIETFHPFHAFYDNLEVFDGKRGAREGKDGFRPSPGPALAPARAAAELKALWLGHPALLMAHADSVTRLADALDAGRRLAVYEIAAADALWHLAIDPDSALPAKVETVERDPVWGRVANSYRFANWRVVDGVRVPFRREQTVAPAPARAAPRPYADLVGRVVLREIALDPPTGPDAFTIDGVPSANVPRGDLWAWGHGMSHWFLRRAAMGGQADEDQSQTIDFLEVGAGLYQVTGSSHHNLLVVGPDSLLLVDAPLYPERSRSILSALTRRWPDKPLSHVVLTHHHNDHMGGLAPYAAAGARIVASAADLGLYREMIRRTTGTDPDLVGITEKGQVPGFARPVAVYAVPNGHAFDMLIVHVPDARLLFDSDLYSPGRQAQNPQWARELYDAITYYGLDVATLVGGHGHGTEPIAALAKLVGE
ncbi:MAG: MBL fold metallo-hydrolase [Alphaproteobacteria bacterium]|nr:MAG: MBL fold metallo-hydrolase [Alphaproteobacteria bacterium]